MMLPTDSANDPKSKRPLSVALGVASLAIAIVLGSVLFPRHQAPHPVAKPTIPKPVPVKVTQPTQKVVATKPKDVLPADPFGSLSVVPIPPSGGKAGQPEPLFGIILPPESFPIADIKTDPGPRPPNPLDNLRYADLPKATPPAYLLRTANQAEAAAIRVCGVVRLEGGTSTIQRRNEGGELEIRIEAKVVTFSAPKIRDVARKFGLTVVEERDAVDAAAVARVEAEAAKVAHIAALKSMREALLTSYPTDAKVVTDLDAEIQSAEKPESPPVITSSAPPHRILVFRIVARSAEPKP